MTNRHDSEIDFLIDTLDELKHDRSLYLQGKMEIGINITIGRENIPIIFRLAYKYRQNKSGDTTFDIKYPLDFLILHPDDKLVEYARNLFLVFGEEFDQAVHRSAYQKFIDEIYPRYYAELRR